MSLVLYFLIGSFLSSYLVTRLYLATAFTESDLEAARVESELRGLAAADGKKEMQSEEESLEKAPTISDREKKQITELDRRVIELENQGVVLDAATYAQLGYQLRRAELYKQAEEAYLRAVKLEPNSKSYLNSIGIIRSKHLEDYSGAEEMYNRMLKLNSNDSTALYNLACNEVRKEDLDKAMDYLKRAVALDRDRYIRLAKADEVLNPLRERKDFIELMGV